MIVSQDALLPLSHVQPLRPHNHVHIPLNDGRLLVSDPSNGGQGECTYWNGSTHTSGASQIEGNHSVLSLQAEQIIRFNLLSTLIHIIFV